MRRSLLLATLSGAIYFLSMPPHAQGFTVWFALVPLLLAQAGKSPRQALLLGAWTGFWANLGAYFWIYQTVVNYSAVPPLLGALLTCLLALQQGLALGLWLCLARGSRCSPWFYPLAFAAVEFAYPIVFPMHLSDCQHACLYTSQCVDLAGPTGLTLLIAGCNVALWQLCTTRRPSLPVALGVALPALAAGYGAVRVAQVEAQMAVSPRLRVALVQHNVGTSKTRQEGQEALRRLQSLSASVRDPGLVVFAETAVKTPPPPHRVIGDEALREIAEGPYPVDLQWLSRRGPNAPQLNLQAPLLFGTLAEDQHRDGPLPGRRARYNTAFLLDRDGNVLGRAFKHKLLLAGEYLPAARFMPWIYTKVLTRASCLTPGDAPVSLPLAGHRLGVSICYEDILPEMSHQLASTQPELMVNLTNDGWFGLTAEPEAHLALARARCIELRLWMARATCTGVSALIDPLGRVVSRTRQGEQAVLEGEVAWMPPRATLFARLGPALGWACVLATLFVCLRGARRGRELPAL